MGSECRYEVEAEVKVEVEAEDGEGRGQRASKKRDEWAKVEVSSVER